MVLGNVLATVMPTSDLSVSIFPPTTLFDPSRDMPSLAGKVMIVTGGNAGIGFETCRQLLAHDAKVYLAARSQEKATAAIERLKHETGKDDIHFLQLDLGDLPSVRKSAETFLGLETSLDVLFNNAGVMNTPTDMLTTQGYDCQFGTNVVGPYLFTTLLLPALKQAHGRIITTSSSGHNFAPGPTGLVFDSFTSGPARDEVIKKWGNLTASPKLYGQSKLGNVLVANLWARELRGEVYSCSLHPGVIQTELGRHSPGWMVRIFSMLTRPTAIGALTQLYAGTTADAGAINGKYLVPWARILKSNPKADDVVTQEKLRDWLEEQVQKF